MTHPFFGGVFNECLTGLADLRDVLPPFLEGWGWEGTLDDFINTWFEVENAVDERILHVIEELRSKGILCCLGTSQEKNRAEYMKKVMGFSTIFDRLFFSCELGYQKPDARFYIEIEKRLALEGVDILFWDDSEKNVVAAREHGWNAEVYNNFNDFQHKLAVYLVLYQG